MATEHQIVPDEQPVASESTADIEMSVEQNTNNEDQPDPVLAPASTTLKRKAFQELETHCDETQKKARLGTRSPSSVRSCSRSPSPRAHSSPRPRHRNYSRSRSNSRAHSRTRPHSHSRSKSRSPSRRRCGNSDAHRRTRSPSPNRRIKREELKKEEQRRGKRLFGGLLNTLNKSQGNQHNSQATKRRQEIEERQKAKLRQQRVEGDKMRAQRGRKVKELRMREQIVFEEQVMLARHENMRMQAQCLRTRAKPHLFYRPWKLTHDQEDDLDAQYDEVESKISRELASFRRRYDDAIEKYGTPVRRARASSTNSRRTDSSTSRSRSRGRNRSRDHGSSRDSNYVSHSRSRETDDIAMRDHTPSTERSDVRITTQHKEDVPAVGQSREDEAGPISSENKAEAKSGPVGQSDSEQGNLTESGISSSGDPTGDGHHTTNPDNMQEDITTQGSAAETTPIGLESKAKGGVVPDATAAVGKDETMPEQAATATSENQQGIEGEAPAERSALANMEQTTSVDGSRHDESGDVVLEADEDVLIY